MGGGQTTRSGCNGWGAVRDAVLATDEQPRAAVRVR
jgi:hypothetical protein